MTDRESREAHDKRHPNAVPTCWRCYDLNQSQPWKLQPPCEVCGEQHAGYENAHK